jgi:hypothetical protein
MKFLKGTDGFASDAEEVRRAVIAAGFSIQTGPDGAQYTGISQYAVPHWFDRIAEVVGEPITPRLSCFRLNLKGELPHSWVHSDDICAEFASVLYLNPKEQCEGGTAFWKHAALGMDRLLSPSEIRDRELDPDSFHRFMTREWKDLTFWQQTGFVGMRFNRFISYPTCYFHSRFPFEAFGDGPENGRLIWVCFFDKGVKK